MPERKQESTSPLQIEYRRESVSLFYLLCEHPFVLLSLFFSPHYVRK